MAMQLNIFSSVGENATAVSPTTKNRRTKPTVKIAHRFVATNDMGIGEGGEKTKFRQNIKAIKTMRWAQSIKNSNVILSPDEYIDMARYNGWGPVANVFTDKPEWQTEQAELQEVLTLDEYRAASASTLNAYYTDPIIIKEMWRWVQRIGFAGGTIIEPAIGSGLFYSFMPLKLQKMSKLVGVELETISAGISKALHPEATILNMSFEGIKYSSGYFDIAISNVPFGQLRMVDKTFNKYPFILKSIHNYYFAKALHIVRDGGLIAFITSRFTMDAKDSSVRQYLSERTKLIAAVRLPSNAFVKNAGTHVTTDIIILQKDSSGSTGWVDSVKLADKNGTTYNINEYYTKHPEMIMGTMVCDGRGLFGNATNCVMPNDENIWHMLQSIYPKIPKNIYKTKTAMFASIANDKPNIPDTPWLRDGSYFEDTESMALWQYDMDGDHKKVIARRDKIITIRAYIKLRDATRRVIVSNQNQDSDFELNAKQAKLLIQYEAFRKRNGYLSRNENRLAISDDPDSVLIQALLEKWDQARGIAKKTSFFTARRIGVTKEIIRVETIEEALNIVLVRNSGKVIVNEIATLVNKNTAEVFEYLISNNLAFVSTKDASELISSDEYLSGNIREKLADSLTCAKENTLYEVNASALKAILPKPLGEKDIVIQPGAYWLPKKIITDFIESIGGVNASAIYIAPLGKWNISTNGGSSAMNAKYGTKRISAERLLEMMLNNAQPTIYDSVKGHDGKRTKVYNPKDTINARANQNKLIRYWYKWIWGNDKRKELLVDKYNTMFRSTVPREYAINTANIKGIGKGIELRSNQKRIAYRALTSKSIMIAHKVGFGKTWSMQTAGMMRKMMGLSNRVMYVVPNHMIDSNQFLGDFLELFPSANILSLTSHDINRARRQRVIARILAEDYDAIIISHTAFTMLPTRAETKTSILNRMCNKLISFKTKNIEFVDKRAQKDLEKAVYNLRAKIHRLEDIGTTDDMLTWEDLSVDALFIDEAHLFKNLWFPTSLGRISGVGGTESGRAFDLYVKTRGLLAKNGFLGFATGTPISNSISEMYIMMMYMIEEELIKMGLDFFDSWASVFAEVVSEMEMKPSGLGWRIHSRMSRYKNVGEMKRIWLMFADVEMDWRESGLVVPDIKTGSPIIVKSPCSPELESYIKECNTRFENLDKVKPTEDNPLVIINDARHASTDIRLRTNAPDYGDSKINLAADNISRIYKETTGVELLEKGKQIIENLTQIVFLDTSTPKEDFNLHHDLRDKLITRGVNSEEIALIHDYKKRSKIALFDAVNAGTIRVLIGTTGKMGVGTNVQRLLYAIHHLDPTWKPSDIEQRDGRIVRQGNLNETIEIYRYVTLKSFDVYYWQTLERKARMAAQAIDNNDLEIRELEEIGRVTADYTLVKVIASDNPILIRKAEITTKLAELEYIERDWLERNNDLNRLVSGAEDMHKKAKKIISVLRKIPKPLDQQVIASAAREVSSKAQEMLNRLSFSTHASDVYGIDIEIRRLNGGSDAIIVHTSAWTSAILALSSLSAIEITKQLFKALYDAEQLANEEESRLHQKEKSLKIRIKELNKPFEYRDEINGLKDELSDINDELELIKEDAAKHEQRAEVK